jgi:hypothetical protein
VDSLERLEVTMFKKEGAPLRGALFYLDTWVSPNSELYAVLTDGKLSPAGRDMKAAWLYKDAHKHLYWPEDKKHLLNWRAGDVV